MSEEARTAAWSRYWRSGAGHSCGGSFTGSYEGSIAEAWHEEFARLPAQATVVDVATGNGPVLQLLVQQFAGPSLHAIGLDLADVAPAWLRGRTWPTGWTVEVRSGVPADRLGLPDRCADLVASQFGIEYAPLEGAVTEALRVLKPAGRLHVVIHHQDSRIVALARDEVTHLNWLLDDVELSWHDSVTGMVEPMSLLRQPAQAPRLRTDPIFQASRLHFDRARSAIEGRAREALCPDPLHEALNWAAACLRLAAEGQPAAARAAVSAQRQALADARTRLGDLLAHALDDATVSALTQRLQGAGRTVRVRPLHERGHFLALSLAS